jgi:hypothetical protein
MNVNDSVSTAGTVSAGYIHKQWGPWAFVLYGFGIGGLILACVFQHEPPAPLILSGVGLVFLALAPCFHYLTVADTGDELAIRFGPLPLFHQRIRYDAIRDVEIGRTMLIEGWGIHMSMLRPGMVWNIWGRDCVVIHHHSTLRLGTNDAENLYAFLKTKIA